MSVSFHGYCWDEANKYWTFPNGMRERMSPDMPMPKGLTEQEWLDWYESEPEANPNYDERIDCNLANANAREVLELLGFDFEGSCVPVEQFINIVAAARRKRLNKQSSALTSVVQAEEGCATIIHCGRPAGYIEATLERLSVLAQAAKEYGATHIGWA
jgi:hypothetical protein